MRKLAPPVILRADALRETESTSSAWLTGMAHTRQKDEDETATPGAAGVSSSRHSSRAPENHWRIKISLPVGEILASPNQ